MRKTDWLLILLATLTLGLTACGDDPIADKVTGGYDCAVTISTRYKRGDQWRDTMYAYADNTGSVGITRIDDNTVSVHLVSKLQRLRIDETFSPVKLTDWHYEANLSADMDSITVGGYRYPATFSGSVAYDPRAISVSLNVKNYPNSNGKYIVAFSSHSY